MPKPVCVKCQRFLRPLKNGVRVLEKKPINGNNLSPPGLEAPEKWVPYKVWQADSWECRGCKTVVVIGYGIKPLWEDYRGPLPEDNYIPVNDC